MHSKPHKWPRTVTCDWANMVMGPQQFHSYVNTTCYHYKHVYMEALLCFITNLCKRWLMLMTNSPEVIHGQKYHSYNQWSSSQYYTMNTIYTLFMHVCLRGEKVDSSAWSVFHQRRWKAHLVLNAIGHRNCQFIHFLQ